MKKCRFLVFAAMVMMLCAVVFACDTSAEERLARAAFRDEPYFSEEVCAEDSYMLSLDFAEYEEYISEATVYRPDFSTEGTELWCIRASRDAGEAAAFLCSVYERPPCDPAEVAAFLACGDMVIFFKGSGETAEVIKREASALFGKFTEYLI
mgnify:FL=1